jgi:hypothetical protein
VDEYGTRHSSDRIMFKFKCPTTNQAHSHKMIG